MLEVRRFLQARKWMKSNASFLKTWHAHVGYKLNLFRLFESGEKVDVIAKTYDWDKELLESWVDVGLSVGHLKKTIKGNIKSKKKMVRFATVDSEESAGILLREMMELHIPTLLEYPDLIQRKDKRVYQDQAFGEVVAETSTLLEKAALPAVMKLVTKSKPGSALDLGCGYGGYLAKIHHQFKGMKLTGVEKNPDVFSYARQRLPEDIQLFNEDLTTFLSHQHDQVDMVMVHNLLYYFPKDERGELLKKIGQLTTTGGKISIITPIHHSQYGGMFTSAFNAFMTAHANLHPLPTMIELKDLAEYAELSMLSSEPIVKEGGWFIIIFTKN